jgi:hypothetical protein
MRFNVVLRRVKKKGDLSAPVLSLKQRLPSYQRTTMNIDERQRTTALVFIDVR